MPLSWNEPTATADIPDPAPREPRTYVVTGGRTSVDHVLHLETQVIPADTGTRPLYAEEAQVLDACGERSVSVAEIAATIRRPVWAAKVLIGDLLDIGALLLPLMASATPGSDVDILRRVLEGLSAW